MAGGRQPGAPFSFWSVRAHGDGHEFLPISLSGPGAAQARSNSILDTIDAVIGEALSLGDLRITRMQEHNIGLRVVLLAAAAEMQAAVLTSLTTAFHSVAQQYLGGRYLIEACFLLPDLAPLEPGDGEAQPGGATLEGILKAIETPPCVVFPGCIPASYSYCWWLGRINASGMTLPPFPQSMGEIAAIIYGLLTTPVDRLPRSPALRDGRLLHMSLGCGELFLLREKLLEYLTAQHVCRLIQESFLDHFHHVEHKSIRRRAWEFAKSPECRQILDEVDLTLGRQRIWTSFDPETTGLMDENDVESCICSVTVDRYRFFDTDLPNLLSALERSLNSRSDLLRAEIDKQVRDIAEHSKGGLFEALEFLEEMTSFLPETSDLGEGETIMNLQQIRRRYDCAAAEMMHVEYPAFPPDSRKPGKGDLRRQIRHLERLRNISSPPALQPEIWDALRWSEGRLTGEALSARIVELNAQLRNQEKSTAQEYARTEHVLQDAHYEFLTECERREAEIGKSENELRQTAMECRRLVSVLKGLPRIKLGPWTFQLHRRSAKQTNEQLSYLRRVRLAGAYRQFSAAVKSRILLSVNRVIYEVRDRLIQDTIRYVRDLHQRISQTIQSLRQIKDDFSSMQLSSSDHLLERSLLTESEVRSLFEILLKSYLEPLSLPSAWDICFQSSPEITKQLCGPAGRPFEPVRQLRFEELVQQLKPTRAHLEFLAGWLAHVSQPLFRPLHDNRTSLTLVHGAERSELGRMLRNVLPYADWIEDSAVSGIVVQQFQEISDISSIHQRAKLFVGREPAGNAQSRTEPKQTEMPPEILDETMIIQQSESATE